MLVVEALLDGGYIEEEIAQIIRESRYIFYIDCDSVVDVAIKRLIALGMYWSEAKAVIERIGVEQVAQAMEKQYPCVYAYVGWVIVV